MIQLILLNMNILELKNKFKQTELPLKKYYYWSNLQKLCRLLKN